ncbi:MAG: phosphotransferase family protein [Planctomycetota bacterium]|jgi:aminoglycoside phosphotransferase (APT) family kinase protein
MLTSPDILPHETTIDACAACLVPEQVVEACRKGLERVDRERRNKWSHAERLEVLYHPQRYLRVAYALSADGEIPGNRYWPEADMVYLQAPVRSPMSRRGSIIKVGGNPVEVYRFPNDRRLRGLRKFARRDSALQTWEQWRKARGRNDSLDPSSLQRLYLRYVPEQKWVIRLRATGDATFKKERLAVRCGRPDDIRALRDRHEQLSSSTKKSSTFRVPSAIGTTEGDHVLGVKWIKGESLLKILPAGDQPDALPRLSARLADLHSRRLERLPEITPELLATRVQGNAEMLSCAMPEDNEKINDLISNLVRRLGAITSWHSATLHNDFHPGQVSTISGNFALFDLERMAIGDPMIDVANMATQLQLLAVRADHEVTPAQSANWSSAFVDACAEVSGATWSPEKLSCLSAVSALDLATGMMRHLRPGWRDLARHCLRLAQEQLD